MKDQDTESAYEDGRKDNDLGVVISRKSMDALAEVLHRVVYQERVHDAKPWLEKFFCRVAEDNPGQWLRRRINE